MVDEDVDTFGLVLLADRLCGSSQTDQTAQETAVGFERPTNVSGPPPAGLAQQVQARVQGMIDVGLELRRGRSGDGEWSRGMRAAVTAGSAGAGEDVP